MWMKFQPTLKLQFILSLSRLADFKKKTLLMPMIPKITLMNITTNRYRYHPKTQKYCGYLFSYTVLCHRLLLVQEVLT